MDRLNTQFFGGIALAVLAAGLMASTDASSFTPVTLLIVGIALIATSRRNRKAGEYATEAH